MLCFCKIYDCSVYRCKKGKLKFSICNAMIQIIYNKVSSMLVTNYCARCQTTSCIFLEHTLHCHAIKEKKVLR